MDSNKMQVLAAYPMKLRIPETLKHIISIKRKQEEMNRFELDEWG